MLTAKSFVRRKQPGEPAINMMTMQNCPGLHSFLTCKATIRENAKKFVFENIKEWNELLYYQECNYLPSK